MLFRSFGLNPIELPNATNPNASVQDKMSDLVEAFANPEIKAVITTIGGNQQVEYVHKLPSEPFRDNPKPFFGYSDNTHFANFLFRNGVPSFYGGCVYTEFAMQGSMDSLTSKYLRKALFAGGEIPLVASPEFQMFDMRPHHAEMRMPALVVVGENDLITTPNQARTIAAGIPGARLAVFPNTGHNPFVEETAAFNALVRDFLRGVR